MTKSVRVVMLSGAAIYLVALGYSMLVWRFDFLMKTMEPWLVFAFAGWCGYEAGCTVVEMK